MEIAEVGPTGVALDSGFAAISQDELGAVGVRAFTVVLRRLHGGEPYILGVGLGVGDGPHITAGVNIVTAVVTQQGAVALCLGLCYSGSKISCGGKEARRERQQHQ